MKLSTRMCLIILAAFTAILAGDRVTADEVETTDNAMLTVTGMVSDTVSQPVSGVTVWLLHATDNGTYRAEKQITAADGRYHFRLTTVPSGDLSVVAHKPGYAVGFDRQDTSPGLSVDERLMAGDIVDLPMTLLKPALLPLQVINADGEPISQRQLRVTSLSDSSGVSAYLPDDIELAELTRVTDDSGAAAIDFLAADHQLGLVLESSDGARQQFFVSQRPFEKAVVLRSLPSVTVNVSLIADDPQQVENRKLTINSRPQLSEAEEGGDANLDVRPYLSAAVVRTDDSGKATAKVIAGTVTAYVEPWPHARFFSQPPPTVVAAAGEAAELRIELAAGVQLTGRVRTTDDDPVAGVVLSFQGTTVRSGADGGVTAWVPQQGRVYGTVDDVPPGYSWPYDQGIYLPDPAESGDTPDNAASATVRNSATILVKKANVVSGKVTDDDGKPVAGATVKADWVQQHEVESYFTLKSDATRTDNDGRFTLSHVYPDVDVRVTARTRDAAVMQAASIHSDKPKTLELTVSPQGMIRIAGRLKGSDGPVIAGADIKIVRALVAPNGHEYGTRPVVFNGKRSFSGGIDGSFNSPGQVPRFGKYSVTISAADYMTAETEYLSPPQTGDALDLGEIVLTKARTKTGIVQDSAGQPILQALVSAPAASIGNGRFSSDGQNTQATTAADGRFELSQLHPRAAVATVHKDGYRLSGIPLLIDSPEISITLFRTDEQIPPKYRIRPAVRDDARRHAAARKLLDHIASEERGSSYFHQRILEMLVRFDPEAALEEIARSTSASARAKTLARLGEIPDALAEVESITDDYGRAFARFAVLEYIDDDQEAVDLLAAALLDAKSIRRPDRRIVVIAGVADRFAQRGENQQAEEILRNELSQARALAKSDWPGFARGSFAAQLARFDPETALEMIREIDRDDQTRHYQNIAHLLANIRPEMAEDIVKRIGKHRYVDAPAVRVAYRMAAVDLPRALGLLEHIDTQQRPVERARGLGVIAFAIKDKDPEKARELLAAAFEAIPPQQGGGGSRADDVFAASMTLLRFAEEIDPDNVTGYFWKTVSNYGGPEARAWSPSDAAEENADRQAQLAVLLALYNVAPELAVQVMDPVFDYWEEQIGKDPSTFDGREATFMAMALTDPERAADFAVRFNDKLDKELRRRIPQPWEVIGNTLTQNRSEIGKAVTREVFHRWVIDEYDF